MPHDLKLGAWVVLAIIGISAAGEGGWPLPPPRELSEAEQRGHDFAKRRCSGCHTIGLDDGGASDGPAFRTLAARYTPLTLKMRFAEVSAHGFDRMPPIEFTPTEAGDLIAYVDTLRGH